MTITAPEAAELLYEVRGDIGYITFNRPAARNALTFAMYDRLAEICIQADEQLALRALVLIGAGGKAFASGTDINQFRAFRTPQDALDYERRIDKCFDAVEACRIPTIAAISGACTGGGGAIAAVCDLRIATPDLRFGFPIARTLGNCLSIDNYARLVGLVGTARVKEMIFTARLIEAAEAKSIGLVSEILPDHAALQDRAETLARHVATMAPLTLRATKESLNRLARQSRTADDALLLSCYDSRDFQEGMDAFLRKRAPQWRGG